jgi:hypothetical protein
LQQLLQRQQQLGQSALSPLQQALGASIPMAGGMALGANALSGPQGRRFF